MAFDRIVAIDYRRWIEFLLEVVSRLMDVRYGELPAVHDTDVLYHNLADIYGRHEAMGW